MNKFTNPLNSVKIASPCSQDWNVMIGTERRRFCGECKLNVYNLSGMSQREAENLLLNSEGRLCVRFYRRADGSVLTKDCPVGWQMIKRRVSKTATAFASLLFGIVGGLGLNSFFNGEKETVVGQMTEIKNYEKEPIEIPRIGEAETTGKITPHYPIAGGISNLNEVRGEFKKSRRR